MIDKINIAKKYLAAGLSIVPVDVNTKAAFIQWDNLKKLPPTDEDVEKWFSKENWYIACIAGAVSHNLEILDFDNKFGDIDQIFLAFKESVNDHNPDLISKLTIARTQSGGYHCYYRCPNPGPNRKLAQRLCEEEKKVKSIIETRGEGGYALTPPTPGYTLLQGKLSTLNEISEEEQELLIALARLFNEYEPAGFIDKALKAESGQDKPGMDFDRRGDIFPLLEQHGWRINSQRDEVTYFTRPGKNRGVSASYNHPKIKTPNRLWVFSSDAFPFEPNKSYSHFQVLTLLEYNGDFSACAKALAAQGYGKKSNGNGVGKTDRPSKPLSSTHVSTNGKLEESREPSFRLTELGNSERFYSAFKELVRYNHTSGQWHIWNGYKWEMDTKRDILKYAKEAIRNMYNEIGNYDRAEQNAFLKFIQNSENRAKLENMLYLSTNELGVVYSDFDKNLALVNLLNKTYDLKQNLVLDHDPNQLLSKSFDVNYDPDANCYAWEAFLETIFNCDKDLIKFIQRAIGLSLCGEQLEEILFFAYGTGKNGKSVFFNVLRMLFNDYFQKAPTEMLLQKFGDSIPNDVARLPGSRLVVAEELPENRTLNENKIKNLTGGDVISARFLHKEFFDFKPTHTLWIFGNHKPNIKGTDDGIWRRICLIPFLVTIPEKDRRSQSELMAEFEEEKAGIFNWMIEGWKEYQKVGLAAPKLVKDSTKEYRLEQDHVNDFIADNCEISENSKVIKSELLERYHKWCQENKEYPMKRNSFYKKIEIMPGVHHDSGTGNVSIFRGIGLATLLNKNYGWDNS